MRAFVLFASLALLFSGMVAQLVMIGAARLSLRDALFHVALILRVAYPRELMPIAALIGTIYALSNLAANSEFTIMRVSGMSTLRLMNGCDRHRTDHRWR